MKPTLAQLHDDWDLIDAAISAGSEERQNRRDHLLSLGRRGAPPSAQSRPCQAMSDKEANRASTAGYRAARRAYYHEHREEKAAQALARYYARKARKETA
jgi:hypothetical protein